MPKRILIADDHESVLRRVRAMIEAQPDWQVCGEAVNGREAVNLAHQSNPDLVILDFAMPHLDGLRTAAEIRTLLPEVPIVMFSMYASGLVNEIQRYGITRLVDKTRSSDLVAAVGELLSSRNQQAVKQDPPTTLPLSAPVLDAAPKPETSSATSRKAS